MGKSLEKLRMFLSAEAKRSAGNGTKPIERVPLKIVLPPRQLHYVRLCPFCRKRGARSASYVLLRSRVVASGASGPKREKPSGSAQGVEPEENKARAAKQ